VGHSCAQEGDVRWWHSQAQEGNEGAVAWPSMGRQWRGGGTARK